jgi:hypothetical protein
VVVVVVVVVCKPILVFHFGPNRPGFKLLTLDLDQAEQYLFHKVATEYPVKGHIEST